MAQQGVIYSLHRSACCYPPDSCSSVPAVPAVTLLSCCWSAVPAATLLPCCLSAVPAITLLSCCWSTVPATLLLMPLVCCSLLLPSCCAVGLLFLPPLVCCSCCSCRYPPVVLYKPIQSTHTSNWVLYCKRWL